PYAAYMQLGDNVIASASPEQFLQLENGVVETRPIKGTRPRHPTPEQDKQNAQELIDSEKDHAENVMIVDLMRNDLSRVCLAHSIEVSQLCALESFATVHHLVSVVQGKIRSEFNALDLLKATFPGGSITGAPKIRAMEIIAECEPTLRGPYCGSIGYLGFNGNVALSITIRTYAIRNQFLTFQTGGAVTIDSDPTEEYEETLAKAKALRQTLTYNKDN
ncbi:MAG TPA: anthranilate synthase component I family protein, partial [Candidatus Berkiella sp.]|nr:anthranilate synthase component I family protein [Candidatus Berkiella sp.]